MIQAERMRRGLRSNRRAREGEEDEEEEQEEPRRNQRRQKRKKGVGQMIITRKIKEGNAAKAGIKMGKKHATATARGNGTT